MLGTLLLSTAAWSQGTTATLSGAVNDVGGAVVPNATVIAKNEATGALRQTVTNGSGLFSFSALPSGDYDVSVQAPGFSSFEENAIHLDPGDSRALRTVSLKIGGTNERVVVTSGNQIISTDSGEQSSLISAEDIKHLSVEGRDVTELFKILPGFAISTGSGGVDNRAYDPSQVTIRGAGNAYIANGTLQNSVAELSDGADITDPGDYGGAMQNLNYDQVAEVKVQTSSFTADGARGPIVVNAVGKSGGSQFHGSLYTYARTSQLNSTDWLANYTGQQKPPDRQVYPGFTLGGPIFVPKVNFNRSKRLTFFVGAEQYAQRNAYAYGSASGAILNALVPTAGMRQGDFSAGQLQQYLGKSYTPTVNADGSTGPGCTGSYSNICYLPQTGTGGQLLVNNNIGPYLDPGALKLLNTFPLPNMASNGQYNWITTNLIQNNLWQARGRIDWSISDKNKLFVVYSTERGKQGVPQVEYYSPRGNMGGINTPGGGLLETTNSQIGSLNLATVISPTLTNEFYVAGAYLDQPFVPVNFAATAGYPYGGLFNNGSHVLPTMEDYGNDGLPLSRLPDATYGGIYAKKFVRTAGDNATKVLGSHTLRAGFFFQMDTNHQVTPFINTNGTIQQYYEPETIADRLTGGSIHNTGAVGSGSGGNYLADFLEGNVQQYSQTNIQPAPNVYFFNIDGYIQDHYRISSRLTVDYGVRFEHFTPWGDAHGLGVPVFDAATYANPLSPLLPGFRWHAIDKKTPVTGLATRWAFVEPRVGFIWDAYGQGNTVVRGGFGIYRSHDSSNDVESPVSSVIGQRTSQVQYIALSQVGTQQAIATSGNGFVPDNNAFGFFANDDEQPQTYTWNLAVDQKAFANSFLEIAYIGNKSNHILNNGSTQNTNLDDLNALPIGSLYGPQPGTGIIYPLLPPVNSTGSNISVGSLDQHNIDQFKKYPLYNRLQIARHDLYANYHGLQVSWTKQQGSLHYGLNYTFSKALGVLGALGNGYPADPFNYRNDYQEESFDHRHIFNAAYSYDFGTLVRNRYVGGVTNGWQLSGITNIQSGSPLPATISPNFGIGGTITVPQGTFGVSNTNLLGTPDVNLQPTILCNPSSRTQSRQWINAACFGLNPNLGQNGPYRIGPLPGPAFTNTDLTAAKSFKIRGESAIQFRVAAFNFINHANTSFTSTDTTAYTLNFNGTFTNPSIPSALAASTSQNPHFGLAPLREGRRIMELALRYDF